MNVYFISFHFTLSSQAATKAISIIVTLLPNGDFPLLEPRAGIEPISDTSIRSTAIATRLCVAYLCVESRIEPVQW